MHFYFKVLWRYCISLAMIQPKYLCYGRSILYLDLESQRTTKRFLCLLHLYTCMCRTGTMDRRNYFSNLLLVVHVHVHCISERAHCDGCEKKTLHVATCLLRCLFSPSVHTCTGTCTSTVHSQSSTEAAAGSSSRTSDLRPLAPWMEESRRV